jgi:hypothetical protein
LNYLFVFTISRLVRISATTFVSCCRLHKVIKAEEKKADAISDPQAASQISLSPSRNIAMANIMLPLEYMISTVLAADPVSDASHPFLCGGREEEVVVEEVCTHSSECVFASTNECRWVSTTQQHARVALPLGSREQHRQRIAYPHFRLALCPLLSSATGTRRGALTRDGPRAPSFHVFFIHKNLPSYFLLSAHRPHHGAKLSQSP